MFLLGRKKKLAATYSSRLSCLVPSAMRVLTAEFGMESGVSPSLSPPEKNFVQGICHFIDLSRLLKTVLKNNVKSMDRLVLVS